MKMSARDCSLPAVDDSGMSEEERLLEEEIMAEILAEQQARE